LYVHSVILGLLNNKIGRKEMNKYNVVFHYHLEINADSKEQAEEFAIEDYNLNTPPSMNDLSITIEEKEKGNENRY